ncbi:universal stress protein [Alcaligenes sp. WGS1538]|uniref:universal stress protein n=1 Tax=Alcaligenes sp. WGS1538 TaxID=3366811 RepID=UPI00372D1222
MYERILVPLDGSRFSEEIIPYATSLAAVHGTELVLLRVVRKGVGQDQALDAIEPLPTTHPARELCLRDAGEVAHAILGEARRGPPTLVAMTSHGRSGLAEIIFGSVAQRILRGARDPVLLYRPTGTDRPQAPLKLRSVVVPLDGNTRHEAITGHAAEFARWADADMEVVNAVDADVGADMAPEHGNEITMLESSYVRSRAAELAAGHGMPVSWEVLHGDPARAIAEHVAKRRDVILAMATRRKDVFEAAFPGSVALSCLRKAGVPILMRLT